MYAQRHSSCWRPIGHAAATKLQLTIHDPNASPLHLILLPIRLFITRLPTPLPLLILRTSRSSTRCPAYQIIARIAIRLRMQVL